MGTTPFHLLLGAQAWLRGDLRIRELIEAEWVSHFQDERDDIRECARKNIAKMQCENRKSYNKNRIECRAYCEDDCLRLSVLSAGGVETRKKVLVLIQGTLRFTS